MIRALIVLSALAGAAHAQGGHGYVGRLTTVAEIWTAFENVCTRAIADPATFAREHPATGTNGQLRVVASDDAKVVVFYSDMTSPVFYQVEYLETPRSAELVCEFHGMIASMESVGTANFASLNAQHEAALRAIIEQRPNSYMAGGPLPLSVTSIDIGDLGIAAPTFMGMEGMEDVIYSIETVLAGQPRFIYANMSGGTLGFITHVALTRESMPKITPGASSTATAAAQPQAQPQPAPVPQPAADEAFVNAVRANITLAMELCLRNMPRVDQTRAAFAQAGFAYTPEDFGGGERIHWYGAPANTVNVAITEGQMAPDCRVTTMHMGVTEAVAYAGAVGQQIFPALSFQYGNMENTPPVTAQNMGSRWEFCTGWIGWNGQRPVTIAIANAGNDPACIEDGSAQIVIVK